jgi:hypothetical protein
MRKSIIALAAMTLLEGCETRQQLGVSGPDYYDGYYDGFYGPLTTAIGAMTASSGTPGATAPFIGTRAIISSMERVTASIISMAMEATEGTRVT